MKYLLIAAAFILLTVPAAQAVPVKLKSGSVVVVSLTENLSSEVQKTGDNVNAIVAADVNIDGQVLIAAGAGVLATITHADDKGAIGEAGKLSIQVTGVYAVDGTFVPVNGTMANVGDDETTGTVVVGVVLCPLALLNEGDAAEIGANTQIRAITISNVEIDPSQAQ